jgi:hypothetical protein
MYLALIFEASLKFLPLNKALLLVLVAFASLHANKSDAANTPSLNDYSLHEEELLFHEVKPRSLKTSSDEVKYTFTTDQTAIHFKITVSKPEGYVYRAQENDNVFENEHVRLYLVSGNNNRNAYVFGINHQSAYFDGIYNESVGLTLDWNGQWDYDVEVNSSNWVASGSIPWQNIPFQNDSSKQNIQLVISKHGNNDQRILSSEPTYLAYTGFFQNLKSIEIETNQASNVELFPYYSLNHSLLDDVTKHNVGGEVFWQRSQNEHIDITINPDFGQVESNDLIVNFSAIEAFFSEQRPFFTRNQSIFDVNGPENLTLLHTPRMGGSSFYEDSDARDITGAGRYNYSSGNNSYSLLLVSEGDTDDVQGRDFLATRAKVNSANGIFGVSANFVNTPSLERKSTVVGLDYFQTLSDNLDMSATAVFSSIDASKNTSDYGVWLQGNYQKNDVHLHEFTLFAYGENLELNDAGFVKRVDRKQIEYEYSMLFPEFNSNFIEQLVLEFEIEAKTNFDNEKLPLQLGVSTEFSTVNDSSFEIGAEWLSKGKDDNLTREFNSTNLDTSWSIEFVHESQEYSFGQIETEIVYGQENWSGNFYEVAIGYNTELVTGVFSELEISQYQSGSWLNWEGENSVDEYDFTETAIDLKLNYRLSESHEFRMRLELVAGEAQGLTGNTINTAGDRILTERPDDFSFSEAAFQFRYKYTLSKLSAVFFSYTFGGEFEDDTTEDSKRSMFSKAVDNKNNHGVFFKTRLKF